MQMRRLRPDRARRRRRVLLVGLPPLQLDALRPPLESVADVRVAPFPGAAFDVAVEGAEYDLVVVDVTYLDESRVRPLIERRLAGQATTLAYVSLGGAVELHDLRSGRSWQLDQPTVPKLVALASGSSLTVVGESTTAVGAVTSTPVRDVGTPEGAMAPRKEQKCSPT